jgi:hypothetical protein
MSVAACGVSPAQSTSITGYFSPPEAFPGPTWTRDGEPVDGRELNSIAGPEHCRWESAVMMHLGWPLGTVARDMAEARQLTRDPEGAIDAHLQQQELELWLSDSDPEGAYLRVGHDVERWPEAEPVVACACAS